MCVGFGCLSLRRLVLVCGVLAACYPGNGHLPILPAHHTSGHMLPCGGRLLRPVVGVVGHAVAIDVKDDVLHERRLYGLQALPLAEIVGLICSYCFAYVLGGSSAYQAFCKARW